MTQPPKLPGSGPDPLEVTAILGIGGGWMFGGIGTLVGFAALLFTKRWTAAQKTLAIAGPLACFLGPLAIAGGSGAQFADGAVLASLILAVVSSIAAAVYLWFTLPDRDGSVG